MKCPACSVEAPVEAVFCPRCGARLEGDAASRSAAPVDVGDPRDTDQVRFGQSLAARRAPGDDAEAEIWEGTVSPWSMLGSWMGAGFLSLTAIGLAAAFAPDGQTWSFVLLGILLLWLLVIGMLVYRRLSIHYRLTSQRLFHEHGLLSRSIDRIEVIKMDDITFHQGLLERMLGVGTIHIKSSDRTDPDFWMRGIDQVRDVASKIEAARRREQVRRSVRIDQV